MSYTPSAELFGTDSFTYTIGDGNGGSDGDGDRDGDGSARDGQRLQHVSRDAQGAVRYDYEDSTLVARTPTHRQNNGAIRRIHLVAGRRAATLPRYRYNWRYPGTTNVEWDWTMTACSTTPRHPTRG